MMVENKPGMRGAEEGSRRDRKEAVGGNSPSRKKRLAFELRRLRAGFAWAWHGTHRSAEREDLRR